jgi:hypothetical protein
MKFVNKNLPVIDIYLEEYREEIMDALGLPGDMEELLDILENFMDFSAGYGTPEHKAYEWYHKIKAMG